MGQLALPGALLAPVLPERLQLLEVLDDDIAIFELFAFGHAHI